ncbi:unnamed protein product [Schistosoma turkestanicum]|nr:unnamed protein product [Schistosoma turkestanicum]
MTESTVGSTGSLCETPIQWPMTKASYEFGKSIGQGATSTVFEALCPSNGKKCAIKIINLEKCSTSASLEEINREIKSMKNMKNENIVAYYASFVAQTELCIIMDLCQRGSLLDVIKYTQNKRDITYGVFDENTIATILRDVLRGLAYIHENGLVHRDLKCGNLLVKDDGIIQIADFGVAGFLATQPLTATGSVDLRRYTFVGTPCWMAPEVMQQARGYNQKADIWSLGITTIEMATGQAPYAKFAPMKVLMLTLQNDSPDIDSVATVNNQYLNYGHKFRKFTKACLMKDPAQRLSARELLSHTYIKSKAKDRDLLCRVLLGGEMPPPIARVNKHPDDRSEKRDPKNNSTEWNFDTVGRVTNNTGGAGLDSDEDSDENDYKMPAYTNTTDRVLPSQSSNSSSGFDFPSELLTQTNATALIGSSNALAPGATTLPPTASSSSTTTTTTTTTNTTLPATSTVDMGGISPRCSNTPHLDRTDHIEVSGSSSSSFPPAPACTPASPEAANSISAMVAAFGSTLTTTDDPNHEQLQQSQTNDAPSGSGICYRITLRKRNPKQNNELQDISFNYVPGEDSADVLARELVQADLLDGCDSLLVAHHMSELISNPAERERVLPLDEKSDVHKQSTDYKNTKLSNFIRTGGASVPPPPSLSSRNSKGYSDPNEVLINHTAFAGTQGGGSTRAFANLGRKRVADEDDYFLEDDDTNNLEYQPAPGSPAALKHTNQTDNQSDDSDDPLDQFMAGINEEVRTLHSGEKTATKESSKTKKSTKGDAKGVRDDIEQEDEIESYLRFMEENPHLGLLGNDDEEEVYEYDADGNIIGTEKKVIDPLPAIDHSMINYAPFTKNFYVEHVEISSLDEVGVDALRAKLGLRVSGPSPLRPICSFAHLGLDEPLMEAIRKAGYTQPTPIQSQAVPLILAGRDVIGIGKTGSALLFSATFKRRLERLARDILLDPVRIIQGELGEANEDITQYVEIFDKIEQKWDWLTRNLVRLTTEGSVLIFVTRKVHSEEVAQKLKSRDLKVLLIHGDMHQSDRNTVIQAFKRQEAPILVATDVASRGLDIPSIHNVINYEVARDIDTHTHRIGRTGRAGAKGTAYTLFVAGKDPVDFAACLVQHLESASQTVPQRLLDIALKCTWFANNRSSLNNNNGNENSVRRKPIGGFEPRQPRARPGLGLSSDDSNDLNYCSRSSGPAAAAAAGEGAELIRPGGLQADRFSAMKAAFSAQYNRRFVSAGVEASRYTHPEMLKSSSSTTDRPSQIVDNFMIPQSNSEELQRAQQQQLQQYQQPSQQMKPQNVQIDSKQKRSRWD